VNEVNELVGSVLAPGTAGDPFARYRRLRELAPVHRIEQRNMTLLSRYADCQRVLSDRETFPVVDTAWMAASMQGWSPTPAQETFLSSLFFRNPPEHTRLRRHLSRGFTTRRLAALRPAVEKAAARALDRLAAEGADGRVVDFQELVAFPLSYGLLGELLGVPESEQARCWDLVNVAIPRPLAPDADERTRAQVEHMAEAASAELADLFTELVAGRRAEPRDDLVSAAITEHEDDPEPLTDRELALAVLPIFGAGVTTLSDTLGNAVHALTTHPEQLTRLRDDPTLVSTATAEVVRYCGGYHIARRYAAHDVDIGGVRVPKDSVLVLLLASTNRDPDRFTDPERFDIGRQEIATLAFGAGIHYCLGAALARLQIDAVSAALCRVPGLRLAGPPVWRHDLLFFGPVTLPVTVVPR
jgi:cytochrome P450